MTKLIIALCLLVLLIPSSAWAKEKNDTSYQYFDYRWEKTKKKNAEFYAKIWKEGNEWHRQDYFMASNRLQMDGHYADADFKVQNGTFTFYYEDGKTEHVVNFDHNKKMGEDASWFENGKQQQLYHYKNGGLIDTNMAWYANGQPSMVAILDHEGNGTGEEFFDDGVKIGSGQYFRGKREGIWKFTDANKQLSQVIKYDHDSAVIIKNYDEKGRETKADRYLEKPAEFAGGLDGYRRYLEANLRYPDVSQEKGVRGVAVLEMVVDKTGKVTAVKLLKSPDAATGAEALRVMRACPDWVPAVQHNRNVRYRFLQRVTFALQ